LQGRWFKNESQNATENATLQTSDREDIKSKQFKRVERRVFQTSRETSDLTVNVYVDKPDRFREKTSWVILGYSTPV
jgi:methionine salvage enolase-phosphatase E1